MKKYLLLLSLLILQFGNVYAQKNNVKILENSYQKGFITKGKDSIYYQKVFFKAFPSNFQSFSKIYAWNDLTNKGYPLNDVALDHINHFFALKCINEDEFIKKIIYISINGVDQADGISFFQNNLIQYVPLHNKEFVEILKTFSTKQIVSVWTFYFDYENSFIRKDKYHEIVKLTSAINKSMIPLITTGYQKSSKNWKEGH